MKLKKWLFYAYSYLNNINEPEILLSFILKIKKEKIITIEDNFLKFKKFVILEKLLNMRKLGIPISYLIKKKEFYSISFIINKKVFIPRFDTECIIDFIINNTNKYYNYKIIDLGTGVGSIAISLAVNLPNSNILGIDLSKEAIRLAKINSLKLNLKNVFFYVINWFNYSSSNKFNIVVSNPPYISNIEFNKINNNCKIYEPKKSLIAKNNGLSNIIYIIKKFKKYICNNGFMILEHGYLQGYKVRKIFKLENFNNIKTYYDLNLKERFTVANK